MAGSVDRAREAFDQRAWGNAFRHFADLDHDRRLAPDDLERFGTAAFLVGQDDPSEVAWERAYREWLSDGNFVRAARSAFWLAYALLDKGEMTRGEAWLTRASRLLEENDLDCVERGYVLIPSALQKMAEGEATAACATFEEAAGIAHRFGDADLSALSLMGRGQSLIQLGAVQDGVRLLDEAMMAVTTDDVSPTVAGRVYCAVIDTCLEVFDLSRARDWTEALTHWCDSQTGLVQFAGVCLLHRAELLQFHGEWATAVSEAQRAVEGIKGRHPAIGLAHYQRAELHRLRGEFELAESAYQLANQCGREPQTGLALMWLAAGEVDAARAAIQRLYAESSDGALTSARPPHWRWRLRRMRATRPEVLAAVVEVQLPGGDPDAARNAADELSELARASGAPVVCALADRAQGAVALAGGDANSAIGALRGSYLAWRGMEAPYEAARTQMLIGLACRELGDEKTARLELNAARRVFEELGAVPDLVRIERLVDLGPRAPHGLTTREVEVLGLVAAGRTNREIAQALIISDHTVRRHLQNIFVKLGVSSRAAATAFAFQHKLV